MHFNKYFKLEIKDFFFLSFHTYQLFSLYMTCSTLDPIKLLKSCWDSKNLDHSDIWLHITVAADDCVILELSHALGYILLSYGKYHITLLMYVKVEHE